MLFLRIDGLKNQCFVFSFHFVALLLFFFLSLSFTANFNHGSQTKKQSWHYNKINHVILLAHFNSEPPKELLEQCVSLDPYEEVLICKKVLL